MNSICSEITTPSGGDSSYLVWLNMFQAATEELKLVTILVHLYPLTIILDLCIHPIRTFLHCLTNWPASLRLSRVCAWLIFYPQMLRQQNINKSANLVFTYSTANLVFAYPIIHHILDQHTPKCVYWPILSYGCTILVWSNKCQCCVHTMIHNTIQWTYIIRQWLTSIGFTGVIREALMLSCRSSLPLLLALCITSLRSLDAWNAA